MQNGPERALYWMRFVLEKSGFPAASRLREQFENAQLTDFCDCGCNSFGVKIPEGAGIPPLLPPTSTSVPRRHWSIYEADFMLADGRSLEIILFADRQGNLSYVEVDCCANSYPVPDKIGIVGAPYRTRASDNLFK
jgi:hypothetical protein